MRLAPVVMAYAADAGTAVRYAALSSRTTHAAPEAVDACRYFAVLLCGAFQGIPPAECLAAAAADPLWAREPLAPAIRRIADGSFRDLPESEVRTSGYVVHTLEAALWVSWRARSFREGCLLAANLGGDADTTAAVYGQFAGAHHGPGAIPPDWLETLAKHDLIAGLADRLHDLRQVGPRTHTEIWPGAGTAPAAT
jgi:ADP-ribosylglycohydrolase